MSTLQRVLATTVLEVLRARQHILVAEGGGDLLVDEIELLIAPALPVITPHLRAEMRVTGEVTSTFGDESADDAVEEVVEAIADQLMESDHVDDIFADDRLIRRDAFRALSDVLSRYAAGDIEVEDTAAETAGTTVELDSLGYVVSAVAQRADEQILREALARAADAVDGELLTYDASERVATFQLDDAAERVALEEALTDEVVDLVDSNLVELPSIEQILQVPAQAASLRGFEEALQKASRVTQRLTGCGAACTIVDQTTLLATLTPLSEEGAQRAEAHFATFLEALEHALAALRNHPEPSDPEGSGNVGPEPGDDTGTTPSPSGGGAGRREGRAQASERTGQGPSATTARTGQRHRGTRGGASARRATGRNASDEVRADRSGGDRTAAELAPRGQSRSTGRARGGSSARREPGVDHLRVTGRPPENAPTPGNPRPRALPASPAAAMLAAAHQAGRVKRRG